MVTCANISLTMVNPIDIAGEHRRRRRSSDLCKNIIHTHMHADTASCDGLIVRYSLMDRER